MLLDLQLQVAAGDEDGAGHVALDKLLPLADVDHRHRCAAVEERLV
jgi:hypothetical protein